MKVDPKKYPGAVKVSIYSESSRIKNSAPSRPEQSSKFKVDSLELLSWINWAIEKGHIKITNSEFKSHVENFNNPHVVQENQLVHGPDYKVLFENILSQT